MKDEGSRARAGDGKFVRADSHYYAHRAEGQVDFNACVRIRRRVEKW